MNEIFKNPFCFFPESYDTHPAYRLNVKPWVISSSNFLEATQLISDLRKLTPFLKKSKFEALRDKLILKINEIFLQLNAQAKDKMEVIFLAELNVECVRLLREELEFNSIRLKQTLNNTEISAQAEELMLNKFLVGSISPKAVQEILELGAELKSKFSDNALIGRLSREDLSANSGRAIRKIRTVLQMEFKRLGVLDSLSAYMGQKIDVEGLAFEMSIPTSGWWNNNFIQLDRAPHTLYAHIDESTIHPKAIVYLSNVGERNGPTSCYPGVYESMGLNPLQDLIGRVIGVAGERRGSALRIYYSKKYHQSASSINFRRHFMRLPPELRFSSHFGWDVLPNSEIEFEMVKREYKMLGPAGTFIVFDGGRLLHRGGLIEQGERIALQVIFSRLKLKQKIKQKISRIFE